MVRVPNKVYVEAGDRIYTVTPHHKQGRGELGKAWWTDRIYSETGRDFINLFALNPDELLEQTFSEYRLEDLLFEKGYFCNGSNGWRLDYRIYGRVIPVDRMTEPIVDGVDDDELPDEHFDFEDEEDAEDGDSN